ncbi:MAG: hypothetical protein ACXWGV_10630 [Solirubrobacterales bacterium]
MSGNGAFEGEMWLGDRDDERLGALAGTLRAALVEAPDPARSAELVPLLAAAARASLVTEPLARPSGAGARRRSRLVLFARVAVAVALVPALFAGLAVAGVRLPDAAEAPFEAVGIELPNQGSEEPETSGRGGGGAPPGQGAEDGGDAAGGGPAKAKRPGARGSENAEEKRGHGQEVENPAREVERTNGKRGRGRALGKNGAAPGQSNPNRGGQGKGKAIGQTDAPPPGQAKKPAGTSKGNSGGGGSSSTGAAGSGAGGQGQGQDKDKVK